MENTQYYKTRINNILKKMQPNSILVVLSASEKLRNQSSHYPYRNNSDILYLTGVNQENIAFVLHSNGLCKVFAEERTPTQNRWEGLRLTALDIAKNIGYDSQENIGNIKDLWKDLELLCKNVTTLYVDFKNSHTDQNQIFSLLNKISINTRKGDLVPNSIINYNILLHESRLYKDSLEIEYLKKAADISTKAHTNLMKYTRARIKNNSNVYEYEFRAFLESEFSRRGGIDLAYSSIVASGNNATILHYIACNSLSKKDNLLLVDAGCEYKGYASDITRTYPVSGKFSSLQKDLYNLVLEAQLASIDLAKPKSTLSEIHKITVKYLVDGLWDMGLLKKCIQSFENGKPIFVSPGSKEEVIEKNYYRDYYMHGTSHYLGLDVHDVGQYFIDGKERLLEPGMCFTIEPGLYFPNDYEHLPEEFKGIGIRIEDNILITDTNHEIITSHAPKKVHDIEELEFLFDL